MTLHASLWSKSVPWLKPPSTPDSCLLPQGEFNLSYFQDGLLPALFLVGLLFSSPTFAECCKHYNAFRLLGIGMSVWCAAVVCSGLSPNFALLLVARAFVGVGEASFVALAAPFIGERPVIAVNACMHGVRWVDDLTLTRDLRQSCCRPR